MKKILCWLGFHKIGTIIPDKTGKWVAGYLQPEGACVCGVETKGRYKKLKNLKKNKF